MLTIDNSLRVAQAIEIGRNQLVVYIQVDTNRDTSPRETETRPEAGGHDSSHRDHPTISWKME